MVRAVLSRGAVSDALVQVKHEIVHIHVIHKLSTPREAASHRRRPRQRHDWAPGRWHRLLTVSTGRAACADVLTICSEGLSIQRISTLSHDVSYARACTTAKIPSLS